MDAIGQQKESFNNCSQNTKNKSNEIILLEILKRKLGVFLIKWVDTNFILENEDSIQWRLLIRKQQSPRLHSTKFNQGMTEQTFVLVISLNRWRYISKNHRSSKWIRNSWITCLNGCGWNFHFKKWMKTSLDLKICFYLSKN